MESKRKEQGRKDMAEIICEIDEANTLPRKKDALKKLIEGNPFVSVNYGSRQLAFIQCKSFFNRRLSEITEENQGSMKGFSFKFTLDDLLKDKMMTHFTFVSVDPETQQSYGIIGTYEFGKVTPLIINEEYQVKFQFLN